MPNIWEWVSHPSKDLWKSILSHELMEPIEIGWIQFTSNDSKILSLRIRAPVPNRALAVPNRAPLPNWAPGRNRAPVLNSFLWYNSHVALLLDTSFWGEDKSMENPKCWHKISRRRENTRGNICPCLKELFFLSLRKSFLLPQANTFSYFKKILLFASILKEILPHGYTSRWEHWKHLCFRFR